MTLVPDLRAESPVVALFSPEHASRILRCPLESLPPSAPGPYTFADLRRLQPAVSRPQPPVRRRVAPIPSPPPPPLDPDQLATHARRLGRRRSTLARAAALYEQALALAPHRVEFYIGLGNVRRWQGDRPAAERCYERAVELDPDHAEQHYGLGVLLFERKAFAEAEPWLREAQNIDPDWADPYPYLALTAAALGRPRDAAALFRIYASMVRGKRRAAALAQIAILRGR